MSLVRVRPGEPSFLLLAPWGARASAVNKVRKLGLALDPLYQAVCDWGMHHMRKIEAAHRRYDA